MYHAGALLPAGMSCSEHVTRHLLYDSIREQCLREARSHCPCRYFPAISSVGVQPAEYFVKSSLDGATVLLRLHIHELCLCTSAMSRFLPDGLHSHQAYTPCMESSTNCGVLGTLLSTLPLDFLACYAGVRCLCRLGCIQRSRNPAALR